MILASAAAAAAVRSCSSDVPYQLLVATISAIRSRLKLEEEDKVSRCRAVAGAPRHQLGIAGSVQIQGLG